MLICEVGRRDGNFLIVSFVKIDETLLWRKGMLVDGVQGLGIRHLEESYYTPGSANLDQLHTRKRRQK